MVSPLVVVLDVDGTIIGDITPQIVLYEISNAIKASGGQMSYKFKDLPSKLNNGIIRPYFAKFIKKTKETIPNIEFFIYTASEKQWATFIVKQIESAIGTKFNKPLFTRLNCIQSNNDIKKAIKNIKPAIFKALKKKYGLQNINELNNRILVVDNRSDVYGNSYDSQYHVICPTYDYVYPENIPAFFTADEFKKHGSVVGGILERTYGMKPVTNYLLFQEQFYFQYAKMLAKIREQNRNYINDTFYSRLYKVFLHVFITKGYEKFNINMVKFFNKQLST